MAPEPEGSAGWSFEVAGEEANLWFLNILVIALPILAALCVGLLGPFTGWMAVLAALVSGLLTWVLILCLYLFVWVRLSRLWRWRQLRKSLERESVARTGKPLPRWPKEERISGQQSAVLTVLAIAGVWILYFATSWSATSWGQPSFIVIVLMVGSAGLWLSLRQQRRGRS